MPDAGPDAGRRAAGVRGPRTGPAPRRPRLIGRLVGNLVDNAVRLNRPEGGAGWVAFWTGAVGGSASLRVANSGPVVPADQVGALFEPFRRLGARRLRSRDGPGHGRGRADPHAEGLPRDTMSRPGRTARRSVHCPPGRPGGMLPGCERTRGTPCPAGPS
ncbi:ATP-binding protein [Streptomyces fructofermentans]|uniref:ATP-binding protein n=1 Tax=Streptomyces fructofermentans TaxID=152141 RepID=UPI0033EF6734